ncbi:MAG: hypothetical protein MUD11_03945 [Rhodobacteraceae bacterium]|nr:hypothetical protein [Paracoccaceae bacterium]
MSLKTKNWKIEGGGGVNLGAVLKGAARLWRFTNQDLAKSYPFLYVEGGAGGAVGMSFTGLLGAIASLTSKGGDAYGGNPVSIQGLDQIEIKSAFSFMDVMGSTGGTFSAGVAAIASVEAKLFGVSKGGSTLFVINMPAVEAKVGVEVNVMSLTGGTFLAAHKDFWDANSAAYEQQRMHRIMTTPPSQNWPTGDKF